MEIMMDVIYLNINKLNKLRAICSDELLENVLGGFSNKHSIIINGTENPSGLWQIDKFLEDDAILRANKIQVILAFAYIGGFVQFGDETALFGDMNVLSILVQKNHLSQNEFSMLVDIIYEARRGNAPLKFGLLTKPNWAD